MTETDLLEPGSQTRSILTADQQFFYRGAVSCPDFLDDILKHCITKGPAHDDLMRLKAIYDAEGCLPSQHIWIDDLEPVGYSDADYLNLEEQINLLTQKTLKTKIDDEDILDLAIIEDIYNKTIYTRKIKSENEVDIDTPASFNCLLDALDVAETSRMSTGLKAMDQLLGGGWEAGELYVGIGVSGLGKSLMLTNFTAHALKAGKRPAFVSTEMSAARLLERIAIPYYEEKNRNSLKLRYQNNPFPKLSIKVYEAYQITAGDIYQLYKNEDIDILFVDYADELITKSKADNDYLKHGLVFRELRNVAKRLGIPVVTVTQGNRSLWSKDGGTVAKAEQTGVGDSLQKLQPVALAWNILQTVDQKPFVSSSSDTLGDFTIEVCKNRYGAKDSFDVEVNYSYQRIGPVFGGGA